MRGALCWAFIANVYDYLAWNGTPVADAASQLSSGNKGEGILSWLAEHPGMRYVILDDHDCVVPQVRSLWVPTSEVVLILYAENHEQFKICAAVCKEVCKDF